VEGKEDEAMIGVAIREALKDAAYAVDWVKDGQNALESLHVQRHDILLLNLGLPGKDGMEALRKIRAQQNPISLLMLGSGLGQPEGAGDQDRYHLGGLPCGRCAAGSVCPARHPCDHQHRPGEPVHRR
jgi:chemotaxis response regulator CheB